MTVSIDKDKCQGHGRCSLLLPSVFDVDDDGLGHVIDSEPPADDAGSLQRALASCPERAISVS